MTSTGLHVLAFVFLCWGIFLLGVGVGIWVDDK